MLIGFCGNAGAGKDTASDFLVSQDGFVKVALADPLKRICRDVFAFSDEQLWGPSRFRNEADERYLQHESKNGWTCTACCEKFLGPKFEEKTPGLLGSKDCVLCNKRTAPSDLHYVTHPARYLTPRHALQQLGTEWGRSCYPNVWVDYGIRTATQILGPHQYNTNYGYDAKTGIVQPGVLVPKPTGVVFSDIRFKNEVEALTAAGVLVVRLLRGEGLTGAAGQHRSETEMTEIPDSAFAHVIDNRKTSLPEFEVLVRGYVRASREK